MKKMHPVLLNLFLIFSFVSCDESEQPLEERKIEISSFRIEGNLQVTINSFDQMNWSDAVALCSKVGNNWRLPTREEFEILATNQLTIEMKTRLLKGGYWTSTQMDKDNAWQASFEFGYPCEFYSKNQTAGVILVKTN